MSKKSLRNVQSKGLKDPTTSARQELYGVMKSIDAYEPYLKDCILLGQHLWITCDKWLITDSNRLTTSAGELDTLLGHVAILRQYHEDMLVMEMTLQKYRKQIQDCRKQIYTHRAAFEAMSIFMSDIMPKINDMQLEIATKIQPMTVIAECYLDAIRTNVSEKVAAGIENLIKDIDNHIVELAAQSADEAQADQQLSAVINAVVNAESALDSETTAEAPNTDTPDMEPIPPVSTCDCHSDSEECCGKCNATPDCSAEAAAPEAEAVSPTE